MNAIDWNETAEKSEMNDCIIVFTLLYPSEEYYKQMNGKKPFATGRERAVHESRQARRKQSILVDTSIERPALCVDCGLIEANMSERKKRKKWMLHSETDQSAATASVHGRRGAAAAAAETVQTLSLFHLKNCYSARLC